MDAKRTSTGMICITSRASKLKSAIVHISKRYFNLKRKQMQVYSNLFDVMSHFLWQQVVFTTSATSKLSVG